MNKSVEIDLEAAPNQEIIKSALSKLYSSILSQPKEAPKKESA